MTGIVPYAGVRILVTVAAIAALMARATAQTPVESSAEARFQLDLHVPDAALATFLPTGWTPNVASQGPAKNANLRAVFIDRVTINGPNGRPVGKGSNRLVYLVAPVKEPGGTNVQLVIGGLTEDPEDSPGPFANYLLTTTHTMERSTSNRSGSIIDSQDWIFAAASGEHLEMHIKFERGVGNKGNPSDTRFYSAKNPSFYQISRQEQVLDILRNVTTTPPDRVKEFSFKAAGGSYAKLFDGTESVLSWDNILWLSRLVQLPSAGAASVPAGRQVPAPARPKIDVSKLGPQVGDRVPDFSLKDQTGKTWTRQSIMGSRGAMLVFVRSADC